MVAHGASDACRRAYIWRPVGRQKEDGFNIHKTNHEFTMKKRETLNDKHIKSEHYANQV